MGVNKTSGTPFPCSTLIPCGNAASFSSRHIPARPIPAISTGAKVSQGSVCPCPGRQSGIIPSVLLQGFISWFNSCSFFSHPQFSCSRRGAALLHAWCHEWIYGFWLPGFFTQKKSRNNVGVLTSTRCGTLLANNLGIQTLIAWSISTEKISLWSGNSRQGFRGILGFFVLFLSENKVTERCCLAIFISAWKPETVISFSFLCWNNNLGNWCFWISQPLIPAFPENDTWLTHNVPGWSVPYSQQKKRTFSIFSPLIKWELQRWAQREPFPHSTPSLKCSWSRWHPTDCRLWDQGIC